MTQNCRLAMTVILIFLISGCASQFPNPENATFVIEKEALNGEQLFRKTFHAHGGQFIDELNDVNVALTGEWKNLITKIQPLVTDHTFRVDSEERILPKENIYASFYTGPAGTKKVVRTPTSTNVFYNGLPSMDADVLSSSSLTADSFIHFLLGPLAVPQWGDQFTRLTDIRADGKKYHRIHIYRKPGFGLSSEDQMVLWVDPISFKTKRVQITLEGHSTTKGAHVEVEYLAFKEIGNFVFPVKFFESVNAPIAIDAHAWQSIGLDINRGLKLHDLDGPGYSDKANKPAAPLQ